MLNPMAADPKYPAVLHDCGHVPTLNEQESAHLAQAKHRAQLRAWSNKIVSLVLRSPLHPLLSGSVMLITFLGHKSGRILTIPVNYVDAPGGILYTPSPREHVWWHNLERGDFVTLLLRGHEVQGFARAIVEPQAAAKELGKMLVREPSYARMLHIRWTDGEPNPTDLARAAQANIVVHVQFPPSKSKEVIHAHA
jgi:hypothetical protein